MPSCACRLQRLSFMLHRRQLNWDSCFTFNRQACSPANIAVLVSNASMMLLCISGARRVFYKCCSIWGGPHSALRYPSAHMRLPIAAFRV